MPIRKPRLSRTEEEEYHRCLQEMQAEGIAVDIPKQTAEHASALDIMVVGGLATLIFNLRDGRAGYAIWLRLVARKSGLIVSECEISTKFDDQIVLESFDQRFPLCTLGQCRYPRAEVLNDLFPLRFHRRGYMFEGVILATGLEPIPKKYLQGMTLPVKLAFGDQFGGEFNAETELYVDRSTTPRPRLVSPTSIYDPEEVPATKEVPDNRRPHILGVLKNKLGLHPSKER